MSARLREALREVADAAPRIDVRPGLFDRARRSRRRRRAVTTAAVLVVVVGIVLGLGTVPPAPRPDRSSGPVDGGLPSLVVSPPRWTADVRSAPVGTGLVVYSGPESQEGLSGDSYPLVVVGPGDQYRTYDRPEWTSASTWSPTFLLSPDGRYLLMADIPSGSTSYSRLLDLRTGAVGILTAGAPLAWSPDGRQAVLVSYAGDATSSDPHGAEIQVVDVPGGQVRWHVTLAPRPDAYDALTAALSTDGSALAVQHGTDLVMRRRGGDGWQRSLDTGRLAGPAAWTPDGSRLTVTGASGRLILLDAATGEPAADPQPPATAAQRLNQTRGRLVAWRGNTPVLVTGDRVLLLTDTPQVLLTAPTGTSELEIATDRLGEPPHRPGPPRPGPFAQRYGHLVGVFGGLALLATLALVVIPVRIRTRRRRRSLGTRR